MTPQIRHLSVDRLEQGADGHRLVILDDDDGQVVLVPTAALPQLPAEGWVLRVPVHDGRLVWVLASRDLQLEAQRRQTLRRTLDRLRASDHGGDVTL
jgi:hypothetical protein